MSKRENHWYLLGGTISAVVRNISPRARDIGFGLLWIALLSIAYEFGLIDKIFRWANSPVFFVAIAILVFGISQGAKTLLRRRRLASDSSNYLKALQEPTPGKLIKVVENPAWLAKAVLDVDALRSQSKAIAYALYGCEQDATHSLAEIDWGSRAALVQAVGLSAEGYIELLCRRDAKCALELNRKALAMSSVSLAVPGAIQADEYYRTCAGVDEALLGVESPSSLKLLEESAAGAPSAVAQLLASFGLAAAMDRSGNHERAIELREFIRRTAPHCRPLFLSPEEFSRSDHPRESERGPVSASLAGGTTNGALHERAAKLKAIRGAVMIVGLFALAIGMYFVLIAQSRP